MQGTDAENGEADFPDESRGGRGALSGTYRGLNPDEFYNEVAVMCFRHFGFKSFDEIDRLTIPQVELMKKALTLRQVDEQNNLHMLAFLTNAAGSVKQAGNKQVPMYQTYKSFFDYEAELYKIEHADEIEAKNNRLRELVEKRGKGGYKNE